LHQYKRRLRRRIDVDVSLKIRSFILENILIGSDNSAFDDDDSFLEKGLIDSTGILELVSFLEDEFEIEVKDVELVPDNFDSLSKLSNYVESKTKN
jgi:acyl carrier protein